MTCTHCGHAPLSMEYTLRFTPERRQPRDVALQLCTACLIDLSSAPDVELVENHQTNAVNPPGR